MNRIILLLLITCFLSACASKQNDSIVSSEDIVAAQEISTVTDDFSDDDYFDDEFGDEPVESEQVSDPLEGWNRMWFSINDVLLLDVIKPVYKGYEFVVPAELRSGFRNILNNIKAPVRIVNSILQFEFGQAMVELGRFMVNSTVGIGGLVEVAKPEDALVPIDLKTANFGSTLAKWGFGEGFYLVLPLFGPSTLRDTFGLAGDMVASPTFWSGEPTGPINKYVNYATSGTLQFNDFGSALDGYEAITSSSIEPYIALRNAYIQLKRTINNSDTRKIDDEFAE